MPEQLWCFVPGDRLMTMSEEGVARIWEVVPNGWQQLAEGPPLEQAQVEPPQAPTLPDTGNGEETTGDGE